MKNGVTEAGLGEQEYNGSLGDGLNDYEDGEISFYSTFLKPFPWGYFKEWEKAFLAFCFQKKS